MKRKSVEKESKSLKTFYLYAALVFLVIVIALCIKLVFIFYASKFDAVHHFTVAITKEQQVKQIISFSPQIPSLAVLNVKDKGVSYASLGSNYGIATDVQLEVKDKVSLNQDVTATMWDAVQNYATIKTDATIVDYFRLMLFSREIISSNRMSHDIELQKQTPENNIIIARTLNDPSVSSENISIQIINASNVSGVGQRLSKVLSNMGANVVDVSTAHESQSKSQIQYFGRRMYTNEQVEKYLGFPVTQLNRQPIADIVIILGEDTINTRKF